MKVSTILSLLFLWEMDLLQFYCAFVNVTGAVFSCIKTCELPYRSPHDHLCRETLRDPD